MKAKQKNAALRLSESEVARLSPAARKTVEAMDAAGWWSKKSKVADRRYEVSWFAPAVERRVTYDRPVKAANKDGAIKEVRAWLKSREWKEHKGVTNFMAKQINPKRGKRQTANSRQPNAKPAAKSPSRTTAKKNPQSRFTPAQLAHLRTEFAKVQGAATIQKHAAEINKVLSGATKPLLKQLADANIEWLSPIAKNMYMRRLRNSSATKGKGRSGKRQNMHPLEVGSHVAMILGGLDTVRQMMLRKKKKAAKKRNTKPAAKSPRASKKNIGLIGLAENLQAADYLRKLATKKKKKNGRGKNPNDGSIFEEFTGLPSTKITNGFFVAKSEPANVDQLGTLTEVKLNNVKRGPVLRFPLGTRKQNGLKVFVFDRRPYNVYEDANGQTQREPIDPKRIHYLQNPVILCAKQLANGARRLVSAQRKPFLIGGQQVAKRLNYGSVVQVSYRAPKAHTYDDNRPYEHYHNMGEEGGRQPRLVLDNGTLKFEGGDYKIDKWIRN